MAKEEKKTGEKSSKDEKKGGSKRGKEDPRKMKPKLDKGTVGLLKVRAERRRKQPKFKRGEWFRYKRLGISWRRPRGVTNKMRLKRRYRPRKVRIGFGKPAAVRGLHPSGFVERMIYNINDLQGMDPKKEAARIGGTVGTKKRQTIVTQADEMGIRVLNRGYL